MITFFNLLCNSLYLEPIVKQWIKETATNHDNLEDFLQFWFESWGNHASTSFALNWYQDTKIARVCLFDEREKKLIKKKTMNEEEKKEALLEKKHAKMLQDTFYLSKETLLKYPALANAFCDLIENNWFSQNKLENKQFICFFKFQFNSYCDIGYLIYLVFKVLQEEVCTNEREYILFKYYVFKYRVENPFLDGLFTKYKFV